MNTGLNAQKFQKGKSLYRELSLWLILLGSAVSLSTTLFNFTFNSLLTAEHYRQRLEDYRSYLAEGLEWPLWNVDESLIRQIGDAFVANKEIALLEIRDDQGLLVYKSGKAAAEKPLEIQHIPITHESKIIGTVDLATSGGGQKQATQRILWLSLAQVLALVLVLIVATRWILSRLLQNPINMLVTASKDMVEGQYGQLRLDSSYTEFSTILAGFAAMSEAVKTANTGCAKPTKTCPRKSPKDRRRNPNSASAKSAGNSPWKEPEMAYGTGT